jgi:deoxycytidine triphosphate deaminase
MLLSYHELKRDVQAALVITHPSGLQVADDHINSSSIEVTLGAKLLQEVRDPKLKKDELSVLTLRDREALTTEEVTLTSDEPFLLYPGAFVLAHTAEVFNLPLDMSAEFRLKSSAGRMGLSHALAVWCDAGWNGSVLTLELHNISAEHIIALHLGDRIGQMIFHRHAPVPKDRSYAARGNYNGDVSVQPARPGKK